MVAQPSCGQYKCVLSHTSFYGLVIVAYYGNRDMFGIVNQHCMLHKKICNILIKCSSSTRYSACWTCDHVQDLTVHEPQYDPIQGWALCAACKFINVHGAEQHPGLESLLKVNFTPCNVAMMSEATTRQAQKDFFVPYHCNKTLESFLLIFSILFQISHMVTRGMLFIMDWKTN